VGLEITKRMARTSIRLGKMSGQDIMEWLASSEMKEETTKNSLRSLNVGALTTLGTFGHTSRRKMMVINLDQLASYQGAVNAIC
jgi:hypothetical protein